MHNYTKITDRSQIQPHQLPTLERNLQIAKENLLGSSYTELAEKYHITSTRVGQIVNAWRELALKELKEESNEK